MKKLFIISGVLFSIAAMDMFAGQPANGNGKAQALSAYSNDTTPKKKGDTSSKKKDTAAFAYNAVANDTTPKKGDTASKKRDSVAFAYNTISNDTTPKKGDTTSKKKDTVSFAFLAKN